MTTRITIPSANWTTSLPDTIRTAPAGAVIVVPSGAMRMLGKRAAQRMGREDLVFEVAGQ